MQVHGAACTKWVMSRPSKTTEKKLAPAKADECTNARSKWCMRKLFVCETFGYKGGGGGFVAGNFRHGIFCSGFISHAVLNLLWEISHPRDQGQFSHRSKTCPSQQCCVLLEAKGSRDFKQRYNMTWRSCDANRAPSTFVHIVADNAWRRQTQFSTPLPAAGYGRDCCLLFSIPAKNVASCRQSSITDSDGSISLFQLLWKGTTDLYTGNCWTRHFAKFRSGFISHSGLQIVWEISHEFGMRNIPRRNNPAAKSPPPVCFCAPQNHFRNNCPWGWGCRDTTK